MLHITTQKKNNHHKKAILIELFASMALLAVFFVPASYASDITVDMVISLVNKSRSATNIAILKKNDLLQKAAEEKAQDMIEKDYFAHVSPEGKSPWYWIGENKYDYIYAGENLAMNFSSAEEQQKAWMESPSHKKNILNPDYDEIGVAVKRGVVEGKETTVVVQMFGKQIQRVEAGADLADKKTNVAGTKIENIADNFSVQKFSDKMNLHVLFNNNAPTLIGWGVLFSLAVIIIVVDIAAVIHKKHKPFFILRETKPRD